MRGIIHNSVVGRDEEVNGKIRKAFYLLSDLPQGITEEALHRDGYKTIEGEHNREKVKIVASVNSRKFLVIQGIPFYASSGTSDDQSVISPAWRKNIWMPFMGIAGHGQRRGRIAKLGDQCSSEFKTFIDKLVNDWACENSEDMASDAKMKLMYKSQNRDGYIRAKENDEAGTLGDLKTQLCRFGHIEAFAIAMQLLPDDIWIPSSSPETEESFESLRSLRDYFLKKYQSQYTKLAGETIDEVRKATFEEHNENFHVLEQDRIGQLQIAPRKLRYISDEDRKERVIREDSKEASDINSRLIRLGADTECLGRLNNPDFPTNLTTRLSALFITLHERSMDAGGVTRVWEQSVWDKGIDEIFNQLMPLEQFLDLEKQKNIYKAKYANFKYISTSLCLTSHSIANPAESNLVDCSIKRIMDGIDEIDSICTKDKLSKAMREMIFNLYHLKHLKSLVSDCLPNIKMNNPAYSVLEDLQRVLSNRTRTPQNRVNEFYHFLTANDSANLNILRDDNSRHMKVLLQGICILVATFLTGILPGLIAMGIVYAASGKSMAGFFKPHKMGLEFSETINRSHDEMCTRLQSPATV